MQSSSIVTALQNQIVEFDPFITMQTTKNQNMYLAESQFNFNLNFFLFLFFASNI